MTREEQWLGAIAGMDGVTPPSMPVWHYEQMLAAIYDAVVGASPAREFPERSWHLDEFLWAVYCAVAGLADPGIPAPTCRIEEFWRGIYLKAMNDEDAAVPTPVWRIEEFLAEVFNNLTTAELKTVTGTMLHVLDALAKPAEELLVSLSPIQDLHGYSSPWPAGGGVNKIDTRNINFTIAGITATSDADGIISLTGTRDTSTGWRPIASYNLPAGNYVFSSSNPHITCLVNWTHKPGTFTVADGDVVRLALNGMAEGDVINDTGIKVQIEQGSTATSWVPYENICPITGRTGVTVYVSPTQNQADATTYTVDWTSEAGTVYGGTLDVVTGVLTVDMANIASYNGETIGEPWLSSLDEYSPGATPTTGAQVVYTLTTPLTYQLTAEEVELLLGENYLWESSGADLSLTYYADGNANTLDALNLMLGNRYVNNHTPEDVSDREALDILLGR